MNKFVFDSSDFFSFPVDPNLISAASFDGTLSIYTLMGGSCQVSRPMNNQLFTQAFGDGISSTGEPLPSTTTHDVPPIKYAPKWMKRTARVSFGVKTKHRFSSSSFVFCFNLF